MRKFLHLTLLIFTFLITGIVLSQSPVRSMGVVTRQPEEVVIAKGKVESALYSNEDFYVSNIYPNPADDYIRIDYSIPSHITTLKIEIRNILGNKVNAYDLAPDNKGIKISISNLDSGIYFYSLRLDNKSLVTRKFIKR